MEFFGAIFPFLWLNDKHGFHIVMVQNGEEEKKMNKRITHACGKSENIPPEYITNFHML